ncbi:hypothetical protein MRS44_007086 [Fusarium solani]|uniref:uncharacterized protein n=1 Tax=Fusarium solani TaxID=169388 RepID=UPI0032C44730|nr:hypothetical protein MRS44_007086 [Fusarium solani]
MSTDAPADIKNEASMMDVDAISANEEAQHALYIDPKEEAKVILNQNLNFALLTVPKSKDLSFLSGISNYADNVP